MIFPVLMLLICGIPARAITVLRPFVVLTDKTGTVDTLFAGDRGQNAYEAPLNVLFNAVAAAGDDDAPVFCKWEVVRTHGTGAEQSSEVYLVRQELSSDFIFEDDGDFEVRFSYSVRNQDGEIAEGEETESVSFSIDASDVHVPNAFSPNGDGKNDLFKVRVKSVVSFKMVIFNRWGRIMASGDENTLEYDEGDDDYGYFICWDGLLNGKSVPDGAYFIHVEAVGAGNRKYDIKSDVNVLTGLGADGVK